MAFLWDVDPDRLRIQQLRLVTRPNARVHILGWEIPRIAAIAHPIDSSDAERPPDPEAKTRGFKARKVVGDNSQQLRYMTDYCIVMDDSFGEEGTQLQLFMPARLLSDLRAEHNVSFGLERVTGHSAIWTQWKTVVETSECPRTAIDVYEQLSSPELADPQRPPSYFIPTSSFLRGGFESTPLAAFPLSTGHWEMTAEPRVDGDRVHIPLSGNTTWTGDAIVQPAAIIEHDGVALAPGRLLNSQNVLRILSPPDDPGLSGSTVDPEFDDPGPSTPPQRPAPPESARQILEDAADAPDVLQWGTPDTGIDDPGLGLDGWDAV